jgi:hypothetical protein
VSDVCPILVLVMTTSVVVVRKEFFFVFFLNFLKFISEMNDVPLILNLFNLIFEVIYFL